MNVFQIIGMIAGFGGIGGLSLIQFIGKMRTENACWGDPGITIAQIASAGVALVCLIIHWFVL